MKDLIIKILTCLCVIVFSLSSYAASKIRFGVLYFYPPFVFSTNSGYIHGFDIDVAKAICQKLNAECTFTAMSLNQLFASLNNNQVDAIMGAISITPERKQQFDFTRPYLKSTMSYVTLSQSNSDPQNLQGKKVGVVKDSTFEIYLRNKYAHVIQLVTYYSNEELVNALTDKQIDIILIDTPAATYWVKYSTGVFKTVGSPQMLACDEGYGIAVRKNNATLVNSLNNALNSLINEGVFEKIKHNYFVK